MHRLLIALACAALLLPAPLSARRQPPLDVPALAAPPLVIADDGAPVALDAATMTIETGAGVVRTTIDMTFRNPAGRVREGNLQFPLPPGQQVVGFALDIDGTLRDAVPVPKARGREVFESIVREGIDPGLLEHAAGDFFRLRIYPFPAHGSRRVRIVLLAPLQHDGHHVAAALPLQFARSLPMLDVTVRGPGTPRLAGLLQPVSGRRGRDGAHHFRLPARSIADAGVATLQLPAGRTPAVQRELREDGSWFVAEVPVPESSRPRALPARVGLLWDSSMSGARRAHALEFALLDAYFRAAGDIEVQLLRLRDVPESAGVFHVAGGDWQALRAELEATVYDGATAAGGWTPDPATPEFLLFGDGLFNYGAAAFPDFAPSQRLFAIQAGVAGDSTRLTALADARNGRAILLRDSADLDTARAALLQQPARLQRMHGIGVADLVAASPYPEAGMLRVAGRLTEARARVTLELQQAGARPAPPITLDIGDDTPATGLAALQWARFSLAQLQADPAGNRARIAALGQRFGIVTPETSLLVLERAVDYARFDIPAPPALLEEVARLRAAGIATRARDREARIEAVASAWQARIAWWERRFPKDAPPPAPALSAPGAASGTVPSTHAEHAELATRAPPAPAPASAPSRTLRRQAAATLMPQAPMTATDAGADDTAPTGASIRLRPWQSDAPGARRLRQAPPAQVYARYLDERDADADAQGTAFYLDAADVLLHGGQTELALRVLSNLSELDLDNPHILRVLAYRLMEADRADLALPLLEQVLAMRDEEPQSHRDLALAAAATGDRQRALDLLHDVVLGDWNGRFAEIEQTALAELNALVATTPDGLDTRAIDPRLLRNLPLDLRVVLSWDSDNSDMDLWVTDPDGEKAYYGNRLTRQGGRMSPDYTRGYGPEEFALRDAKPGVYRVEANFFGDHQQLVTGATTLQVWLSTGFGTPAQQDKRVTLRLQEARQTAFVGEFRID
ncbi:DUF2135 domain-containing protein [Luteimonas sp. BDR2-5]|uniref:VIT domain-containing protein n=1 Tax=Proluteimonas luteida TaxID=2878685 RepID=UPI001E34EED1|nr:VIT domain-containing protein [Luteimonas sp. BDR2-5]MCD9028268.1 DUF2135 domain-containing protein [Luteimonas sp. BDR2-5]